MAEVPASTGSSLQNPRPGLRGGTELAPSLGPESSCSQCLLSPSSCELSGQSFLTPTLCRRRVQSPGPGSAEPGVSPSKPTCQGQNFLIHPHHPLSGCPVHPLHSGAPRAMGHGGPHGEIQGPGHTQLVTSGDSVLLVVDGPRDGNTRRTTLPLPGPRTGPPE